MKDAVVMVFNMGTDEQDTYVMPGWKSQDRNGQNMIAQLFRKADLVIEIAPGWDGFPEAEVTKHRDGWLVDAEAHADGDH